MNITIQMTIPIDAEAYRLNYGEATTHEIQSDVIHTAREAAIEHFKRVGILCAESVRRQTKCDLIDRELQQHDFVCCDQRAKFDKNKMLVIVGDDVTAQIVEGILLPITDTDELNIEDFERFGARGAENAVRITFVS